MEDNKMKNGMIRDILILAAIITIINMFFGLGKFIINHPIITLVIGGLVAYYFFAPKKQKNVLDRIMIAIKSKLDEMSRRYL